LRVQDKNNHALGLRIIARGVGSTLRLNNSKTSRKRSARNKGQELQEALIQGLKEEHLGEKGAGESTG